MRTASALSKSGRCAGSAAGDFDSGAAATAGPADRSAQFAQHRPDHRAADAGSCDLCRRVNTSSLPLLMTLARARPRTRLPLAGGSIGQGLPLPSARRWPLPIARSSIPHGDGGAAYTMQALWTMAREKLDVTTSSTPTAPMRSSIHELYRVGVDDGRRQRRSTLDLHNPEIELDADRERSGRRGEPCRHGRRIRRAIWIGDEARGTAPDRSDDLGSCPWTPSKRCGPSSETSVSTPPKSRRAPPVIPAREHPRGAGDGAPQGYRRGFESGPLVP